jgi:hypothetical protein
VQIWIKFFWRRPLMLCINAFLVAILASFFVLAHCRDPELKLPTQPFFRLQLFRNGSTPTKEKNLFYLF